MQVRFKEKTEELQVAALTEQKLYQGGNAIGWLLALNITEGLNSTELDELLTEESISEISVISENAKTVLLTGYSNISSCVVRYTDEKTVIELQLMKKNTENNETVTAKGV